MFGEFGPKLKGGLNTLLAYGSSTLLTLKGVFNVGVSVIGGDGNGLKSGSATTGATGGAVNVTGGTGFSVPSTSAFVGAQGGDVNVTGGVAGAGGNGGLGGGAVTVAGGIGAVDYSGFGTVGGVVTMRGGQGGGYNAAGGAATVKGGAGGSTGTSSHGGDLTLSGGDNGSNGHGGNVTLSAGTNADTTLGATVTITGTGQAGNVALTAGTGWTTAGTIALTGGAAQSGNNNGGAITLTGGAPAGTGARGNVNLNGTGSALATTATGGFTCLPTCAGLPTGVPASIPTGTVPSVYDTTNARLMVYTGGAWAPSFAAATQAEQETATSLVAVVTPGRQKFHPSAVKAWCKADTAGAVTTAYNVGSVTDIAVGRVSFALTTAFSSADYAVTASAMLNFAGTFATALFAQVRTTPGDASTIAVDCLGADTAAPAFHDPSYFLMMASGDQ